MRRRRNNGPHGTQFDQYIRRRRATGCEHGEWDFCSDVVSGVLECSALCPSIRASKSWNDGGIRELDGDEDGLCSEKSKSWEGRICGRGRILFNHTADLKEKTTSFITKTSLTIALALIQVSRNISLRFKLYSRQIKSTQQLHVPSHVALEISFPSTRLSYLSTVLLYCACDNSTSLGQTNKAWLISLPLGLSVRTCGNLDSASLG
jgi:hypothetical protein